MLLFVKIKPNQRFDRVEFIDDQFLFRIRAQAIDGKANDYLVGYLSELLEIPKSKIIIKKGQTARIKCLEILADETLVRQQLLGAAGSAH